MKLEIRNRLLPKTLFALVLTVLTLITIALIVANRPTPVSAISSWNPGRIIDDTVFTNKSSMTASQIQSFLNSKVPNCDTNGTQPASEFGRPDLTHAQYAALQGWHGPPYVCLKDYVQDGRSAAQIIYDAAQEFSISPQVLVVLLQKEQALVTDTWPLDGQYRSATGYGCPDTAPCDSEYYGFTNQVSWSARMFRAIMNASPTWYTPYIVGNNYIQYNPNASCGGSTVFIQNRATQALYNYTPYQPNQAALDAGWGTALPCGAYGNRNFYLYFTDWFGPTTRNLITTIGDGVYLVEDGAKRAFPNEITFLSYSYRWSDVLSISNAELNQIPDGVVIPYNVHFRDGLLVRSPSGGMYIVANGTKRPFPNEGTFFSYGYTYSDASLISTTELNLIPDGVALSYNVNLRNGHLVSSPSGGMYVVDNGTKRAFPNEITFLSYGYTYSDALVISGAEISLIPDGMAMPYKVLFRNGRLITSPSKGVYRVENGAKRAFPNEITFLSYLYKWSEVLSISSTELNLIPNGTNMPYNVHFRNGHLVSSPSGGMYIVDNGTKRPFPNEAIFFSYGYKYSDALIISVAELDFLPDGVAMPPKA